jgi:hypothetical protein
MSHFSSLDRPNLPSSQCRHGYRLSVKRQKFHPERFSFLVDMYHCADISRLQALSRNALPRLLNGMVGSLAQSAFCIGL